MFLPRDNCYYRWKYIKYMRYEQFYNEKKGPFNLILCGIYKVRKNRLGRKLGGYEVSGDNIGAGIQIFHNGSIIIHRDAIIGVNCKIHGEVCIGNDGVSNNCPRIGDYVDIGIGAKILGDCYIANGIKIGAGAVVVSSFNEENITIAGVPAKKLHHN